MSETKHEITQRKIRNGKRKEFEKKPKVWDRLRATDPKTTVKERADQLLARWSNSSNEQNKEWFDEWIASSQSLGQKFSDILGEICHHVLLLLVKKQDVDDLIMSYSRSLFYYLYSVVSG